MFLENKENRLTEKTIMLYLVFQMVTRICCWPKSKVHVSAATYPVPLQRICRIMILGTEL